MSRQVLIMGLSLVFWQFLCVSNATAIDYGIRSITSASSIELGEIEMLAITSDGGLETNFSLAFTQRKEEVRGRKHLMKGKSVLAQRRMVDAYLRVAVRPSLR